MKEVKGFKGKYKCFSNFTTAVVELDGISYPTTEHAYQAAKTLDPSERKKIREAPRANLAKKLGQKVKIREDWEEIKLQVMEDLIRQKFTKYPDFKVALLNSGDAYLEETNHWHDEIWGVCTCGKHGKGMNHLGKILMKIREELKGGLGERPTSGF